MVYGFISHELEQLRHPNFASYLNLSFKNSFPKFAILTGFYSEMFKVRESTENDVDWKVHISRSTGVKAFKF